DYSALTRAVKGIYEILEQRPDSDEVFASEEDEIDPEDLQAAADYYDEHIINSQKQTTNGKTIKVQRLTPTIRRGEERSRCSVHGRGSQTITRVGHLSNKEVSGYSLEKQEPDDW
ncbi:MAG: hypothetical protein ACW964_09865, partial [Candidatus Hodarchaeales archaeon]